MDNSTKALAIALYGECYEKGGMTAHEIAAYINEELGLELDESTYRKAYTAQKVMEKLEDSDDKEHLDRLAKYTHRDIRQREQRKFLVRERAAVDLQIKDWVDKQAVSDAIVRIWNTPLIPVTSVFHRVMTGGDDSPIYAYGDVHWDYTYTSAKVHYDKSVAQGRLDAMFQFIQQDAKAKGFKKIVIADLGDDIEGAALRASQLLRITEAMAEQAKGYSEYLKVKIKETALTLPDVEITFVHVEEDNHSQMRLHNTKRDELPENLQLLITTNLRTYVDTAHEFGALTNLTYVAAPEVIVNFDGVNVLFAHSHQYNKSDNLLDLVRKRHEVQIDVFIGGHWHQYKHTNRDVFQGFQQSLIFINPIVGDTDYSEKLLYSGRPGFTKVMMKRAAKHVTSEQILIDIE